jgi:hypothetical protein
MTPLQRIAAREEFERTATELSWYQPDHGVMRMENGAYLDLYLELRWQGWYAAMEFCEDAL